MVPFFGNPIFARGLKELRRELDAHTNHLNNINIGEVDGVPPWLFTFPASVTAGQSGLHAWTEQEFLPASSVRVTKIGGRSGTVTGLGGATSTNDPAHMPDESTLTSLPKNVWLAERLSNDGQGKHYEIIGGAGGIGVPQQSSGTLQSLNSLGPTSVYGLGDPTTGAGSPVILDSTGLWLVLFVINGRISPNLASIDYSNAPILEGTVTGTATGVATTYGAVTQKVCGTHYGHCVVNFGSKLVGVNSISVNDVVAKAVMEDEHSINPAVLVEISSGTVTMNYYFALNPILGQATGYALVQSVVWLKLR